MTRPSYRRADVTDVSGILSAFRRDLHASIPTDCPKKLNQWIQGVGAHGIVASGPDGSLLDYILYTTGPYGVWVHGLSHNQDSVRNVLVQRVKQVALSHYLDMTIGVHEEDLPSQMLLKRAGLRCIKIAKRADITMYVFNMKVRT